MRTLPRRFLAVLLPAMLAILGPGAFQAHAQDKYPSRPVRIVVPFGPGASTDMLARLAANELTKRLGQAFIVDNVAGAGGAGQA